MQIMPGKSRSGHGTKRPFDSDVSRMSIPLSGTYVVPTLFIVTGLLALSAPIPAAGVLLLCAVVGATAATIAFALQRGTIGTMDVQRIPLTKSVPPKRQRLRTLVDCLKLERLH